MNYILVIFCIIIWALFLWSARFTRKSYIDLMVKKLLLKKYIDTKVVSEKWGDLYGKVLSRFYDEVIMFLKRDQKKFKK